MISSDYKDYYDVIIIGSGVSGLTSGALFSRFGFSVCVLEMDANPGGYLAGFRRKDFRFDTAIHWLNQCGENGMVSKIFRFIGSDYPKPEPMQRIHRYKSDDHDYLLTNNPDEFKEQLIKDFPHEKKGIIKFFKAAKKIGASLSTYDTHFRTMDTMSLIEKASFGMRMGKFGLPFLRWAMYDGDEGVKKGLSLFFKDKKLHKLFSSEENLLSTLIPIAWAYFGDYQKPPKGGGQMYPEWLVHVIESFKNDVFYKAKVKEILLEKNKAVGVKIEHRNQEYTIKSKYVVATCDVETLYEKMLPQHAIPEDFKTVIRNADIYSSSVSISIALDCPSEQLGFGEELTHLYRTDIGRDDHRSGDPSKSSISILSPSARDKTLAPENCGTLTLFVSAFMEYKNNWGTTLDENGGYVRNDNYKAIKEEFAKVIIDRVNEIHPGLKDHILFYDIATPVTHWRYTGNKKGSMMGAKHGKKNMKSKVAHHKTAVENLYLSGHWSELGGGVPYAVKSASNSTLHILKKENHDAFRLLANYMDGKIDAEQINNSGIVQPYYPSWIPEPTPAMKKQQL